MQKVLIGLLVIGVVAAAGLYVVSSEQDNVVAEEQERLDDFAGKLRYAVMHLEDTMANNDEERHEDQIDSVMAAFEDIDHSLKEVCGDKYSDTNYFTAYNEAFFGPLKDQGTITVDDREELLLIYNDMREMAGFIYPLEPEESVFYGLQDWQIENMKVGSFSEYCEKIEGLVYGEIPEEVLAGERDCNIDEDQVQLDETPGST